MSSGHSHDHDAQQRGFLTSRISVALLWLLVVAGLLIDECAECGISEWRGRKLVLHLDHINGIGDDNRIENLRLLCPNCDSQSATYCGRNMRKRWPRCR